MLVWRLNCLVRVHIQQDTESKCLWSPSFESMLVPPRLIQRSYAVATDIGWLTSDAVSRSDTILRGWCGCQQVQGSIKTSCFFAICRSSRVACAELCVAQEHPCTTGVWCSFPVVQSICDINSCTVNDSQTLDIIGPVFCSPCSPTSIVCPQNEVQNSDSAWMCCSGAS